MEIFLIARRNPKPGVLEVGKNDESIRLIKDRCHLNGFEMLKGRRNIHHMRPSMPSAMTTEQPR